MSISRNKSGTNNMLTGIRDLDREILKYLPDKDFLQMCGLNRTYSQRVCNDDYFRIRTENGYPETIPYKDYTKPKTWKKYYLNILKYIHLLQKDFNYEYGIEDKSPELLYLARVFSSNALDKYEDYSNEEALTMASTKGNLAVVKYLLERGADISYHLSAAIIWASNCGHLEVAKYLVRHGSDVNARNGDALIFASYNGHLPVVKYLIRNGSNISSQNNKAVIEATRRCHLHVVKYLIRNGADISAQNNRALKYAIKNNQDDGIVYLQSLK